MWTQLKRCFPFQCDKSCSDGVSESDNPFLNAIAEQANVTFTDVTVPPYTDWQTKFNMIVTSGNMPDLVHSIYPDEVNRQGANGAFVELTDIIKNSPVLSKLYDEEMLELMQDENGKIYGLRSLGSETPSSCYVRKDLIDEVNGGKMPSTPEEYYEFFKNIKAKYPDAVPMTTRGGLAFGHLLFYGYGVKIDGNGANWQYTDGKFINAFEAKHAREAVEFHKKLYDEGLLDKTFVTNKIQDENDRKYNKQLAVFPSAWATSATRRSTCASTTSSSQYSRPICAASTPILETTSTTAAPRPRSSLASGREWTTPRWTMRTST